MKHSKETIEKIRAKALGRKMPPRTPEHLKHLSESWTDKRKKRFRELMSGDKNPGWKGGIRRCKRGGGYRIQIRIDYKKYQDRARYNMEKHIGRKLRKGEIVHHMNGNTLNDDITNLMLFPDQKSHLQFELKLKRFTQCLLYQKKNKKLLNLFKKFKVK